MVVGASKVMAVLPQKHHSIWWEVLWSLILMSAMQTLVSFQTSTQSHLMELVVVSRVTSIVMMARMINQIAWKWIGLSRMEDVEEQPLCTLSQALVMVLATIGVAAQPTTLEAPPST